MEVAMFSELVPFESNPGEKRIFVTDNGKVAVVATLEDGGWWMQTLDEFTTRAPRG